MIIFKKKNNTKSFILKKWIKQFKNFINILDFFFRLLKQREKQRDAAAQIRSINNRTTPEGTLASKVYNIPSPPQNSVNSPTPTWDNRGGTHPPPGRMPVFYHSSGGQHFYEEAEDVSHHMSHQPVSENSYRP